MEPNTQSTQPPYNPVGTSRSTARDLSDTAETLGAKVSSAAHAVKDQVGERASETMDQAKRRVGELYDSANRSLNQQYDKAMNYTRENPGTTTLIAFGAGVGVGMLLISNLSGSRSRRSRVIEPVMNAVSTLASELFR
jgi:ElaB/YqjD/DUF883 family membrane-anchored ribosome-binding protein